MKKALLVTSISPNKSAGLILDLASVLENLGYSVDILTKYKEEQSAYNIISAYDYFEPEPRTTFAQKIKKRFPFLKNIHKPSYYFSRKNKKSTYAYLVNEKEDIPSVPSELFLHKIKKGQYEFVIITFMQYMLSTKSIGDIYQHLKVPIFLYSADMFPMTGGCHYFENCRNFLEHCGHCPILGEKEQKDQTYFNYSYKKSIYNTANVIFLGNKWMNEYAGKAPILENVPIRKMMSIVNEDSFCIKDKKEARQYFDIDENCFLMFAGAANLAILRKGFKYLIESVNKFVNQKDITGRKIVLLLAGQQSDFLDNCFYTEIKQVGFLSAKELSLAYSAADVFLCPSIEDAGPSMINQSLMCGTPVISFNMGVALDLIENHKTGVRVELKDTESFANAIRWAYQLSNDEQIKIRKQCRQIATDTCSKKAIEESFALLIKEFVQ